MTTRKTRKTRKLLKLAGKVAGVIVGIAAVAAGVIAILAYVGWNPFAVKPVKPANVVDRILAYSDTVQQPLPSWFNKDMATIENICVMKTEYAPDQEAMKCWLQLSDFYSASARWRSAIDFIDRAHDINVRIADPYYKLGDLYYNMLLLGLIEEKHYKILNEQDLLIEVMPDSNSRTIAGLVNEQYQQAQNLPLIGPNVPPANESVTDQNTVAQTQDQVAAITNGASVITLSKFEVLRFLLLLSDAYPKDKTVSQYEIIMMPTVLNYIKAHPDEFPGMMTQLIP